MLWHSNSLWRQTSARHIMSMLVHSGQAEEEKNLYFWVSPQPISTSSSSAFAHGKPQRVSPVLVMKSAVVSIRSPLVPQSFPASVAPFGTDLYVPNKLLQLENKKTRRQNNQPHKHLLSINHIRHRLTQPVKPRPARWASVETKSKKRLQPRN